MQRLKFTSEGELFWVVDTAAAFFTVFHALNVTRVKETHSLNLKISPPLVSPLFEVSRLSSLPTDTRESDLLAPSPDVSPPKKKKKSHFSRAGGTSEICNAALSMHHR